MRLYTAGFSDFERIRTDGRIYVDKTYLIYRLTQESKFVFLNRPRRFGKSLLCSTLKYYFQGRKDLFEGLSIMKLEQKWNRHPVLHFDISACKHKSDENVIKAMKRFHTNILELGDLEVPSSQFDVPTEAMTSALPLLYQSGYLTIKSYDPDSDLYKLGFPNAEVKVGFMENFLSSMMEVKEDPNGFAKRFYVCLKRSDIDGAMKALQAFFASIPYLDFGQKELEDIAKYEAYYQVLTYVVFSTINCRAFTEVKAALGRTDMVVFLSDTIYVMELKTRGTAQDALDCINSRDYAIPYQADGRKVVKIGIAFSKETRTVSEWMVS